MRFDGTTYQIESDFARLCRQHRRVHALMRDGRWRTLAEIAGITGDPPASISARLRDFRKQKFGCLRVNRRRRGEPTRGLFEYQLLYASGGADNVGGPLAETPCDHRAAAEPAMPAPSSPASDGRNRGRMDDFEAQ